MKKPKEWTAEDLKAAAVELDRLGRPDAANLARKGYPCLAAYALAKARAAEQKEANLR